MSRKSIKIRDSTHEQLSREKNESESWDEFLGRIIERSESISPEEAREAVREVIREDATTDMIRTEVRSVLAAELSDEMQKAVEDDPVKETVKSVVEDILSDRGVIVSSLPVDQDAHDELVNVVKTAPSRGWMDRYFDMCQQLIELHDLERDDDLLVMSIRSDQNALPFSIGPRYVLKAYVSDEKIGVILPHGSTAVEELEAEATYKERFSGNDRPDPHYYKLPAPSADDFGVNGYEADWLQAVEHEVDRGHNRLRADAHKPVVYEAAVNLEYRKQLLDDAGLHEES